MSAIKTFDYLRTLSQIEPEVIEAIQRVLRSGHLILGEDTHNFEHAFAAYVGADHCIGVSSGTTALHLALLALDIGPGDEVITVANTCTPTVAAIELAGAIPILVDINDDDLMISPQAVEAAITARTRAVIVVHLWGQSVHLDAIKQITTKVGVRLIEDCAQACGTRYRDRHVGNIGDIGCFSFYPTKNLGAYGDAGAAVTNDAALAERLRRKRMYGYTRANYTEESGMNARIAEIQAAILCVKLRYLDGWLNRRQEIAAYFNENIHHPSIRLPRQHDERVHSYHQYVVRCEDRARVIGTLEENEIGYGIHYETPIHKMPAFQAQHFRRHPLLVTEKASQEVLSLPVHEALSDAEVEAIVEVLEAMP